MCGQRFPKPQVACPIRGVGASSSPGLSMMKIGISHLDSNYDCRMFEDGL